MAATTVMLTRTPAQEAHLRRTVEQTLSAAQGRAVRVRALSVEPSPFASRVPAEVVSVTTDAGERLSLFLKSPGPEESDHPDKQVRDRESRIYRNLLAGDSLPVPRFYGSAWNESLQRREVLLEYVNNWDLRYHGLDEWFTAAARLGDLHRHFAARADELARCDYLLRLDASFFTDWARRALEATAEQFPELARRLQACLPRLDVAIALLDEQPKTLVHNDLAAKNVVVDSTHSPARVCIVDWEMAGIGCGLLDLVTFKYGLDPLSDRRMCEAYFGRLGGSELLPRNDRELRRVLSACECHKVMTRLWRNRVWRLPPEKVGEWLDEAESHLRIVEGVAR